MEEEKRLSGVAERPPKGKIVMATVKGDVHDIGKNIVGVVLQCNNYEVIDLGVMVPAAKILETAKREKADIIGLSGLITPSLDEMCFVATEMEREGFNMPLLIGGATTSRVHTAVKIQPELPQGPDHLCARTPAARSAWCRSLLSETEQQPLRRCSMPRASTSRSREAHARQRRRSKRHLRSRPRAQQASRSTGRAITPPKPQLPRHTHVRGLSDLAELVAYIDWSPFFQTWELTGRYPAILEDDKVGVEARTLFADAQAMLEAHRDREAGSAPRNRPASGRPTPSATTSTLYTDDHARSESARRCFTLRQQIARDRSRDRANVALADFVAPQASGVPDYIGGFAVTAGIGEDGIADRFKHANDDYSRDHGQGAGRPPGGSVRRSACTSACAREFWGYAPDETLSQRRADRGEISRHPPGARLSGAARPHGESDAVPTCSDVEAAPASN